MIFNTSTQSKKQVLKTKICCSCLKTKELEKGFYKNSSMKDGRFNRCKICVNLGFNCRPKPSNKKINGGVRRAGLYLGSMSKDDWIETYHFLKMIGYDLNVCIHDQFCSKYNLEPKKRTKEKSILFTASDLGLI